MKDFRGMKRQRNRNRKPSSGNQGNPNRAYESNGPENTKVRGNAQTIYERYQQLARDANSSGDRVLAENHLQHAEHYFRMIRQMQPQRPVAEFLQRDPFASPFDDFDDDVETEIAETEAEAGSDEQPQGDESQPRYDRQNGDRQNGDRQNGDRYNGDRNNRDRDRDRNRNRPNGERFGSDRQNGERIPGEQRVFEPRGEGDGERRETRRERYERRRAQRLTEQETDLNGTYAPQVGQPAAFIASTEPLGLPAGRTPSSLTESVPEASAPRERPQRREAPAREEASHLPAFLSRPAPIAGEPAGEAAPEAAVKPKRAYTRKPKADAGASVETE